MKPTNHTVTCCSAFGLHRLAYRQWGDPKNSRVLICVHGVSRQGRDFDRLAKRLCDHYRVVCPDMVGRGKSDWLAQSVGYGTRQYLSDLVNLVSRLDVEVVDWVGTSMGGALGMSYAGLPKSPIRRMVVNDVGPRFNLAALTRIGSYLGAPKVFASQREGLDYLQSVSLTFGELSDEQWTELNAPQLVEKDGGWIAHYDPRIRENFAALNAKDLDKLESHLWQAYDAISCPVLLMRGAESDLLSKETALEMCRRGPKAKLIEIPNVGHAPMLVSADQIDPIVEFLKQ